MTIFSNRISKLERSASIELAQKAKTLLKEDPSFIDLSWGEPDCDSPEFVKEKLKFYLDQGKTKYTNPKGIEELRIAIRDKLEKENGLKYSPENILVTPGAKQAIFYVLLTLLNKGDEVILPEPYWLSYRDMIALCEGKIVPLALTEDDNFKIDPKKLKKLITKKTKAVIINNPNNPTGAFYNKEILQDVADILAEKQEITIISDEIYEKIIFDDNKFTSFACLKGAREKTITINGFSKGYAMTGWRLGYIAAEKEYIDCILTAHQHISTCASSFSQFAAFGCFKSCEDFADRNRNEYQKRRDILFEGINKLKHFSCTKPGGTFYLFMNIKKLKMNSKEASNLLLEKARLVVTPGSSYGTSGEGFVRIAFTKPVDIIKEVINRLEAFDNAWSN